MSKIGTTIKVSMDVKKRLERHASYSDTMDDVVRRLLDKAEASKD